MVEQQINFVVFSIKIDNKLVANEAEIAAHFNQKLANMVQNRLFQLVF